MEELTEEKRNDIWKVEREKRLKTMGNSHLWDERESRKSFFNGFETAIKMLHDKPNKPSNNE